MRLLVVTARYPTLDRPAAGAFVRDRLADPDLRATVVAPRRYDLPGWRRYLRVAWDAMTARGRFDGVEGHFILPTGPIALLAARMRRVPLVVYAHGSDVQQQANRSALSRILARWVLRSAACVVTNSPDTAAHVSVLGASAKVIPPGIDLSRFSPSPRPTERRVLYLGGDVEIKGVRIARELAHTLVGPGIREVDPSEVPGLIAAHDIVLVPSLDEPYGLVAAEAIASGRWVVAGAVGGLRQIVTDGVTGTLVSDGDYAAALARLPDYDPTAVASHAGRFSAERHRAGMRAVWRRAASK